MTELLHEAINLIRADRLDDARQLLFEIIRNDSQNEVAWIWLAETFSSDLDRLKVLNACKKNVPNNNIVNMAITKLRKRIDDTSLLRPGVNPFIEGGTFDPAAREPTGHTGAIIGFDGSFIVSDVPDFADVIDLRVPSTTAAEDQPDFNNVEEVRSPFLTPVDDQPDFSTRHLPPVEEKQQPENTSPSPLYVYEPEIDKFDEPLPAAEDFSKPLEDADLDFESDYRVDPNIFLDPRPNQTGELNYEPDLSRFLSDEFPGSKPVDSKPKVEEPVSYELPNAINFNKEIAAEKPNYYTSPYAPVYPPAKTEAPKPVTPQVAVAATPIDQLRNENLANDPFLESAYGEEEKPKRKGIRRNVLLISGLFTLIVMLCLITVMVLSGYSLNRAVSTPTFSAALVGELNPVTPRITLPPIESPTAIPSQVSTDTPEPTGTPAPTGTPTETPLLSSTPTSTPTRMNTPTRTRTGSPTPTDRPGTTNTPSRTPTQTPTGTNSPTPTPSSTYTQAPTATDTTAPTSTNTPVNTNTPRPTFYPTVTPVPPTPTDTPVPPIPTETQGP